MKKKADFDMIIGTKIRLICSGENGIISLALVLATFAFSLWVISDHLDVILAAFQIKLASAAVVSK